MKHFDDFLMLFAAIVGVIFGGVLLRSFFRDFSLIDFSWQMTLLSLFGGAFLIALGMFIGFYAFKRMKN